jgi:hypothetical protein
MQARWARWARYPALGANPVPGIRYRCQVPGTGYQKDLSLSLRPFITPLLRHSVTLKG